MFYGLINYWFIYLKAINLHNFAEQIKVLGYTIRLFMHSCFHSLFCLTQNSVPFPKLVLHSVRFNVSSSGFSFLNVIW
jgi:hypothetical protein